MNSKREIYGIASTYTREHGEDAVIEAAIRADALLDAGVAQRRLFRIALKSRHWRRHLLLCPLTAFRATRLKANDRAVADSPY